MNIRIKHQEYFILAIAIFVLFGVVHFPVDSVLSLTENFDSQPQNPNFNAQVIIFIRGFLFTVALFVVLYYTFQPITSFLKNQFEEGNLKYIFKNTLLVTAFLSILMTPPGLLSMGYEYGQMSLSPFAEPGGFYHQRLLMPALGYLLFLRGQLLYFIFTITLTMLLIFFVILWLHIHQVNLALWQQLSLATSSFIIYQFQAPGYPDVLLFVLILLMILISQHNLGQLSLFTLCLLTHEGSIFVLIPVAFFYFKRPTFIKAILIGSSYFIIWLGSYGFNLQLALNSRNVGSQAGWQWIIDAPFLAIAGFIIAYKVLWIFILMALWILGQKKQYKTALKILAFIGTSLIMVILAVDTSRLVGFGFLALLFSMEVVYHQQKYKRFFKPTLVAIYFSNLLIPSFYIGLNHEVALPPGLYQTAWLYLLGNG